MTAKVVRHAPTASASERIGGRRPHLRLRDLAPAVSDVASNLLEPGEGPHVARVGADRERAAKRSTCGSGSFIGRYAVGHQQFGLFLEVEPQFIVERVDVAARLHQAAQPGQEPSQAVHLGLLPLGPQDSGDGY